MPVINFSAFNVCSTWPSLNNKQQDTSQPFLSHHHRGWWNEMNEMSVETWRNEIYNRENRRNFEETYQILFRPQWNPDGMTEMWTRDPSGGRWAFNACAMGEPHLVILFHLIITTIHLILLTSVWKQAKRLTRKGWRIVFATSKMRFSESSDSTSSLAIISPFFKALMAKYSPVLRYCARITCNWEETR